MIINCVYKELVDTDLLIPNPKNPNKHNDKQIKLLAKIIEYQGWRHPIIVSKQSGFIAAGHARLEAAKANGYDKVPVDYQDFTTPADEFLFMISDNKIAELAEHDDAMMIEELKTLEIEDLDLTGIPDFYLPVETFDADDNEKKEKEKKFIIEVEFPNDMEMMEHHDDLINQGYIVRIKLNG